MVENTLEGYLDPGKAVLQLIKHVTKLGAIYLTGSEVLKLE
jgi:hypothetical protein